MAEVTDPAPQLPVPGDVVINIEHPGVVKNIDRAVASLGGEERLGQYLHDTSAERTERNLKLNLCPDDHFRTGIDASTVKVSNLVLRVSVPKRTGRRRRKGSSEPFQDAPENHQPGLNTRDLLRSMQDNEDAYSTHVIGQCNESHRFRRLPDFQFSVMDNEMAQRLSRGLMSFDYDKIRDFKLLGIASDKQGYLDQLPPPRFSQLDVPFNYLYMDNPAVSHVSGADGKVEPQLRSQRVRSRMHMLRQEDEHVPDSPLPECRPENTLSMHIVKVVAEFRALLEQRPVITRRAALNLMNPKYIYDLRIAVQYCSYMFKSGPFKDSYCKFGVDPRRDAEMRKYQTLGFQLKKRGQAAEPAKKWTYAAKDRSDKRATRNTRSHVFDGISPPSSEGRTWQICDITDPCLARLLSEASVRNDFDQDFDGWFHSGTMAVLRTILKDKMDLLAAGLTPNDADYEKLLDLPSIITESNIMEHAVTEEKGTKLSGMLSSVRNMIRQEIASRRAWRPQQQDESGTAVRRDPASVSEEHDQDQDELPEDEDDDEDEDMDDADGLDVDSDGEEGGL